MTTVLEGCAIEEQLSVVRFLCARGLIANDIPKQILAVYRRKFSSRKAVHNWMANVSLMTKTLKRRWRKWLRQQSKYLYAAGFDALRVVKRWGNCINAGGGYVEK
jgi:hypothetical protein